MDCRCEDTTRGLCTVDTGRAQHQARPDQTRPDFNSPVSAVSPAPLVPSAPDPMSMSYLSLHTSVASEARGDGTHKLLV